MRRTCAWWRGGREGRRAGRVARASDKRERRRRRAGDPRDHGRGALGEAGRRVVGARLGGPEASVIAICDTTSCLALPPARDHKRLRDGDQGPNTGVAWAPCPRRTTSTTRPWRGWSNGSTVGARGASRTSRDRVPGCPVRGPDAYAWMARGSRSSTSGSGTPRPVSSCLACCCPRRHCWRPPRATGLPQRRSGARPGHDPADSPTTAVGVVVAAPVTHRASGRWPDRGIEAARDSQRLVFAAGVGSGDGLLPPAGAC